MASIYDRADIYDLIEDEKRFSFNQRHWQIVLEGKEIHSLLDVSIGSGSLTLPLAELGVELFGSDLSASMLTRCEKKAAARGVPITLKQADFRKVSTCFDRQFDCVASTGNSLPHVSNADALQALAEMGRLVKPGGWLYFDLRNWDKSLRERQRFYLYNPFFDGDTRVNLVQVWDYHDDGTMTFNLLYTFERDNRINRQEIFTEHYDPIPKALLLDQLQTMGYQAMEQRNYPAMQASKPGVEPDWYCVIAQKRRR